MMPTLPRFACATRIPLALFLLLAPGCAVTMNGEPLGPSAASPAPPKATASAPAPSTTPASAAPTEPREARSDAERPALTAKADDARARADEEKEKRAKEREALVERSKETVALEVPLLGVAIPAPGDASVVAKATRGRSKSSYVQGPVSGFVLELADGADDRASVDERIQRETSGMKNVKVLKKRSSPDGGYSFEFLWTQRFVDPNGFTTGTQQRTGVFVKRVVGNRAVHCYLFAGNEATARETLSRCEGIKPL